MHNLYLHHSPYHMCWDLLLSRVTLLQYHDDHFHRHSGEQSTGTVINSRAPMNNNDLCGKLRCLGVLVFVYMCSAVQCISACIS